MIFGKSLASIQEKLSKIINKFEAHTKDTDRRLDNIEKVLIAQEMNLQTHMKRSDHLEVIVEDLKSRQEEEKKDRSDELRPIQKHITMIEGVFKFLGIVGVVISFFGGLAKLFGLI